jgi:hypothetical protein
VLEIACILSQVVPLIKSDGYFVSWCLRAKVIAPKCRAELVKL